ncbi:fatty acid-binding protein 5 isoform X1 [Apteryx mantelli]|uniref:Fatty acid-binding protein 5 isoform X1 n=2 Tax=Apteryx TaxID=8821 RepID=A0ABM4E1S0_9AVES
MASKIRVALRPVKSILVRFCPFEPNVESTRIFLQRIYHKKIYDTNRNCEVTTDVRHDGSEPLVDVMFGVGMAMRKMGSVAKPDVYIIKDGDTITVKTESTFKTSQFSFKLGEKFEENTLDGRKTQTLVSLKDDGSLIQEQEWGDKKTIITRKLVDGQLVVECNMNGVKCVRVYQKA